MSEAEAAIIHFEQLVTVTEAAKAKKMTVELLRHHLKKPDAPKPVYIGREHHRFYDVNEIEAWKPKRDLRRAGRRARKVPTTGETPAITINQGEDHEESD